MGSSIIGGALGLAGSLIGGSKSSSAAKSAAEASKFVPYDITSGLGSGLWDGYSGSVNLSPAYQTKRDYYLDQADFFNSQLGQFTPPTLDQFITGYADGGAAPQALSYEDWAAQQGGGSSGGESFYTDPVTGQSLFFDPRTNLSDHEKNIWRDQVAGLEAKHGPNDFQRSMAYVTAQLNNADEGGFYSGQGGPSTDTSQAAYDQYVSGLEGSRGAAQYDQEAYQSALEGWKSPEQRIYDRLFKMAEPGESLQRSSLENRLFAQGMLGSTGGQHRSKALEDSLGQKALGREHLSVNLAEQIQNMIQRRGINATQQALGIDQAGLDNLRLGAAVGTSGATAGANAARFLNEAGQNSGDSIAAAFSSFGNNLPDGLFSSASTPPLVSDSGGFGIPSSFVANQPETFKPSIWDFT